MGLNVMKEGTMRVLRPAALAGTLLLLAACGGGASPASSAVASTAASKPAAASAATSAAAAASAKPAASAAKPAAAGPASAAAKPAGSAAAGTGAAVQGNLTVFAAASLTDAFNNMKTDIEEANPAAKLTMNFAGSPTLRTQLAQGAKADVFASADTANMDGAHKDGTIDGQPSIFAHNKLTVVLPGQNPKVASLQDLAKPGIKVVIEQQAVPAGNYSRQALDKMSKDPAFGSDFATKVLANVVSQEPDVKSVLSRIQLGEADAGMLYVSDVGTPAVKDQVKTIAIPDQFNVIADYPLAAVKNAPNPAGAKAFIDYVLGPLGQATLQKWGLVAAKDRISAA
jgi:molybdate transport system substrate-binding protein